MIAASKHCHSIFLLTFANHFSYMKNILSKRFAAYGILTILSLMILFHLLILAGLVPFDRVWGGRIEGKEEMVRFELISIATLLVMLGLVAAIIGKLKIKLSSIASKVILWLMFGVFVLNTIGNLSSKNDFEQMVFTPVTVLLSLFCLQLLLGKKQVSN